MKSGEGTILELYGASSDDSFPTPAHPRPNPRQVNWNEHEFVPFPERPFEQQFGVKSATLLSIRQRKEVHASISTILTRHKPKLVFGMFPLWWQYDAYFQRTCNNLGVPTTSLHPNNLQGAKRFFKDLKIDGVVVDAETAPLLYQTLAHKAGSLSFWVTIHTTIPDRLISYGCQAYHELHVAPGIALGVGCEHIMKEPVFHLNPSLIYAKNSRGIEISSESQQDIAMQSVSLPLEIVERKGDCHCGRKLYSFNIKS